MATKDEVLKVIAKYKEMLGEERVKNMGISDDWSNAKTLVVLLCKEPFSEWYQSRLDNEATREQVWQKVNFLLTNLHEKV
mgnify:CR=1 FL=1